MGAYSARMTEPKAGFEVIDLDPSRVLSVEQGLADAAERYKGFAELAREAMTATDEMLLFESHLPLLSFINRAVSLHAGITSAVKEKNPHAAFTLLRAYLELVVLVRYVDLHPDYLEALKRPIGELPKGTRKQMWELFEDAATEMRGVRHTYDTLSEMAHFGSTALWHPFTVGDAEDRRLTYGTAPHWKKPGDAQIVLGMLLEADESVMVVLERYRDHHVTPVVVRHVANERAGRTVAKLLGGEALEPTEDNLTPGFTLPAVAAQAALAAGVAIMCEEHGAIEPAPGVTSEQFEAWAAGWLEEQINGLAAEVYGDEEEHFFATPRASLDGRTPRQAIDAGDGQLVLGVLAKGANGEFA